MQPKYDPITTACIYYTYGPTTIQDPARWLEHMDQWVSRWRGLYKQGARKSWLCERYLVGPVAGVQREVEKFLKEAAA